MASVPINAVLVSGLGLTASPAWVGTNAITGVANYFVIRAAMGAKAKEMEAGATTATAGAKAET